VGTSGWDLTQRVASVYKEIDDKGFDVLDVLHAHGSGIDALAYAALFWPEFMEHRGMVVRALEWGDADQLPTLDATLERHGSDRREAEKSVNWVDVGELFGPRKLESSQEDDLALARLLREMWAARLSQSFPDRRFAVEILTPEDTGGGPGVSFWQVEL
jgi:hypothetical protein